jgi:hypothetical protein
MENQILNVSNAAHPKMSPKYKTVQTNLIAQKFKDLGFVVDSIHQRKSRHGSGGYGKHMVKLSHPELLGVKGLDDVKLQLVITNSFDGSSRFMIGLGFFRFVCANGMIVGETLETFKHKHTGMILEELDESIERIVAQTKTLAEVIQKMKSTELTTAQIISFEEEAKKLRGDKVSSIEWTTRRTEDQGNNLFVVYNRIQEDLIRGGTAATSEEGRARVLREIKSVDKLKEINGKLFDIAAKLAA